MLRSGILKLLPQRASRAAGLAQPRNFSARLPRVLSATIAIGFCTSITKVAGAAKVIATARYFGAGDAVDAFLIAFLIPSFIGDVIAGCFAPSVIPSLVRMRSEGNDAAARQLSRTGLAAILTMLGTIALLLALCGPWVVAALGSSFSPEKLRLAQSLFLTLLIWLPLSGCIANWRAVLNAHDAFALPAAAPVSTPVATIAALYVLAPGWGVSALCIGTVAGVAIEASVLACAVHARGFPITPAWDGWTPEIAAILRRFLPMIAAALVSSSALIVDQAVAGMLGSGGVSELAYGTKLVSVILAVGAAALSTSVLPVFSELAAGRDWPGLRRRVITYSAAALAVSVPVTAVLFMLSPTIVRIFYQHGAFQASTTEIVANIQRCALVQIPFAILLALATKLLIAISANALLARVAIAGFVINLICDFAFAHWIGIAGIALATAVVQFLSLVFFAIVLERRFTN